MTPYLQRKSWERADRELAELKKSNPDFYAKLTDPNRPKIITTEYIKQLDDYLQEEKLWRFHRGRDIKNQIRSASFLGVGRLRHAVGVAAERERLAIRIEAWSAQGRTLSNIALLATNAAGKPISVKAIRKLLKERGKA